MKVAALGTGVTARQFNNNRHKTLGERMGVPPRASWQGQRRFVQQGRPTSRGELLYCMSCENSMSILNGEWPHRGEEESVAGNGRSQLGSRR